MDRIAQVFRDLALLIQRQHPAVAWMLARNSDWRERLVARLVVVVVVVVVAVELVEVGWVRRRMPSGTFGCRRLGHRASSLAHRTLGRVGRNDFETEIQKILRLELSLVMSWTRSIEHSPWWFVQMQVLLLDCRVVVVVVAVAVAADRVELLPRMKVRLAQVEVKSWEILPVLLEKEYVTL